MRVRWFWVSGIIGFCVGVLAGAFVEFARLVPPFRERMELTVLGAYGDAAYTVDRETAMLAKLRNGAIGDATQMLEDDLDSHLYTLATYEEQIPVDRRQGAIYRVLKRAAAYRREHPQPPHTTPAGQAIDAAVANALALGDRAPPSVAPPNKSPGVP